MTSISEFEKKWDHYNYGLNKVDNRFASLKFLLAYNNNKIISENVGKSYFQLNSASWLLAPDSRYDRYSVWVGTWYKHHKIVVPR